MQVGEKKLKKKSNCYCFFRENAISLIFRQIKIIKTQSVYNGLVFRLIKRVA